MNIETEVLYKEEPKSFRTAEKASLEIGLEEQKKAFEARGGKIQHYEFGHTADTPKNVGHRYQSIVYSQIEKDKAHGQES